MNTKLALEVYALTRRIPKGKVSTYGDIALQLGSKNLARVAGNILHNNPNPITTPCHRVVNAKGQLAKNFGSEGKINDQEKLLKIEGVVVNNYQVDLKEYRYKF